MLSQSSTTVSRNKHQLVKNLNAASVYNASANSSAYACSLLVDSCLCLLSGDGSETLLRLPSAALMTAPRSIDFLKNLLPQF